jgi:propanol-preferring alcohol dehydrogenase
LTEVPEPRVAPDEALIEVRAVGVCGTDLKITGGLIDTVTLPRILGHEVSGVVASEGGEIAAGKRVACYLYDPCGSCAWCARGQQTLCPNSQRIGMERDGGMARFVSVKWANLLPFADTLPFECGAVAMDAVMSPWRALRVRAQVVAGERVVIAGAGGLGLNGVQVAVGLGAMVAVLDPVESHRLAALDLGAELAVRPDELQAVLQWSSGGADVGFEASGSRPGFDALVACLRPGGRVVANGYRPGTEFGLDSAKIVLGELTIMGSRAGSREDARDALAAVEQGAIRPLISHKLSLDEVNKVLDLLRSGDVLGRIVIQS